MLRVWGVGFGVLGGGLPVWGFVACVAGFALGFGVEGLGFATLPRACRQACATCLAPAGEKPGRQAKDPKP